MFEKLHNFMKEKPVISFLIIIVLILIIYYIYQEYIKNENFEISGMTNGAGGSISVSLILVLISTIQILILYYIIKIANKNAIKETTQSQNKS